jgi:hypothetical protein
MRVSKDQKRRIRKQQKVNRRANHMPKHFFATVGWTAKRETHIEEAKELFASIGVSDSIVGIAEATVKQCVTEAMASLSNAVLPLPSPIQEMNDRRCWQTVGELVKEHGGRAVAGWSVMTVAPKRPQKNPLASTVLNAHCVREKDGVLLETIAARQGLLLVPAVLPTGGATVEFYDTKQDARKCLPYMRFENELMSYTYVLVQK